MLATVNQTHTDQVMLMSRNQPSCAVTESESDEIGKRGRGFHDVSAK